MSLANLAARPLVALLAFVAWSILLVLGIGAVRITQVLTGEKKPNEFPSGSPHGSDRYWRLNRAHANALENLPIFAAIVLTGAALGVSSGRLAQLSEVLVGARVAQSIFHVASGSSTAVNLRFAAFATQLVCYAWMILETLRLATA